MPKKPKISNKQQRSIRTQQIILGIIGIVVILSMIFSLFMTNF